MFLHDAVDGETSVAFVVSMKSFNAESTFARWAALETAYPFLWPVGSALRSPPIIVALDSPCSFVMPLLSVCWTYSWRSKCPEVAWWMLMTRSTWFSLVTASTQSTLPRAMCFSLRFGAPVSHSTLRADLKTPLCKHVATARFLPLCHPGWRFLYSALTPLSGLALSDEDSRKK